jgi:hypothetical protein
MGAPGTNWFLVDAANRWVPGQPYAGLTHYLAVAGYSVQGKDNGKWRERRAYRLYRMIGEGRGDVWGDGVVPVDSQKLEGAETMVLHNVHHSLRVSRQWYGGSKEIIRQWWPKGPHDGR